MSLIHLNFAECRRMLVQRGPDAIAECFDVFYSLLRFVLLKASQVSFNN